jgi:Flp pilus assembly protein TadB
MRRIIVRVRAPPITIACDCGEMKHVPYGERWTCEQCGRRWNTAQIPPDEYWGIMRAMRRMRLSVIGIALGLTLVFGLLALFVSQALFLLLPVVLAGWFIWYMPWWRRKMRRQVRSLPKWKLHPE